MKKIVAILNACIFCLITLCAQQKTLYVSPAGSDAYAGTLTLPFKTIACALAHVATLPQNNISILLRKGTYRLDTTLVVTPGLLQNHSLTIAPFNNEKVTISGGRKINPVWKVYKGAIRQAFIGKGLPMDGLFCNGHNLPLARYPNYDSSARVFNGTAADAISPQRVKTWSSPYGGLVHALHSGEWGSFDYRITGVDSAGRLTLNGGWQMARPAPMHPEYRFVENIFEELDAPGEWFYNAKEGILYLYPPNNVALKTAVFEYSALDNLIVLNGTAANPVNKVTINGITFTETKRTFMQTKEILLRSDWAIYRGGAVLLNGTEHVTIQNCQFKALGSNAIFVSNYNRNSTIAGNEIYGIGASAICFVGSATAVRSPAFGYEKFVPLADMDMQPGPKSTEYPAQCTAFNNLIHDIGNIEKQSAGVDIDMALKITVSHNTIYNVPRSGINIGDGCWGGHMVEYNNVFNTVQETGDHGAFNSWGRDRFWLPRVEDVDSIVNTYPTLPFLDAVEPITLRNNLFYCTHGWDIDLDDGSSNYHIYNNLCLNGGLKLREGFGRVVENNIMVNNSFHPHVWYINSNDVFRHNIVCANYAPIGIRNWGREVDSNFFMLKTSLAKAQKNNTDKNSRYGNPQFNNPAVNNYSVLGASPALEIGFKNFSMDAFGVVSAALKAKAAKVPTPGLKVIMELKKGETVEWLGANIKNIEGLGERSATGLFDENGVLVVRVADGTLAQKSGLQARDVIRTINTQPVNNVAEFLAAIQGVNWQGTAKATIVRNQQEQFITLVLK